MSVFNLHDHLSRELIEAWNALHANSFRDDDIRQTVSTLLSRKRYDLARQCAFSVAVMAEAGIDPASRRFEQLIFRLPPPRHVLRDAILRGANESNGRLTAGNATLAFTLDGGVTFDMRLTGRALMRVLLGVHAIAELAGHEALASGLAGIGAAPRNPEVVAGVALGWSDSVGAAVRIRAGGHHGHAKLRTIRRYLARWFPGEGYASSDLEAAHVLEFWSEAVEANIGWKLYASAHSDFLTYADRLCEYLSARGAASHDFGLYAPSVGKPKGGAVPEADTSEATVREGRDAGDDAMADAGYVRTAFEDWEEFTRSCAAVDFLKRPDLERVEWLAMLPPDLRRLRMSSLRVTRFESVENALARLCSEDRLAARMLEAPTAADVLQQLTGIADKLETAAWASLHVLLSADRSAAWPLAQELAAGPDLASALGDALDDILASGDLETAALLHLRTASHSGCVSLRRKAERAFRSVARKGFRDEDVVHREVIEAHAEAAPHLPGAIRHLRSCQAELAKLLTAEPALSEADTGTFEATYRRGFLRGADMESERTC